MVWANAAVGEALAGSAMSMLRAFGGLGDGVRASPRVRSAGLGLGAR